MCISSKKNMKGAAPIYVRITAGGHKVNLSTGEYINPNFWDTGNNRVKGHGRLANAVNQRLDQLYNRIIQIRNDLDRKEEEITAEAFKLRLSGEAPQQKKLLEVFEFHNKRMKGLIDKGYSQATYDIYERTKTRVGDFIKHQYKVEDISLRKLDASFISGYDYYLRTVKTNENNTVYKNIQRVNKIVNMAVDMGWVDRNPFHGYKISRVIKDIVFLTEEELETIKNKSLTIERLSLVRDIFIFCCFTGLAYNEVNDLCPENISKGIDGKEWIIMIRRKTGRQMRIPLLPLARDLMNKYKNHPLSINRGKIFPVLTNQKMNAYLKEISTICGINKELTTHIARKTFATTVTLLNDVPLETVSELLGHSNIRITQEAYGKIVDKKVSRDMEKLSNKLSELKQIKIIKDGKV